MFQLFSRRYLEILPAIAGLTILAGVGLMWKVSAGFDPRWMSSRMGIALSFGAAMAIVAFAVGVTVIRGAAVRIFAIMRALPQADDAARAAMTSEMADLRARAKSAGRWVAALLLVASVAMAVARYI